ncbi:MAG: hypothetical protein MZU97_02190 [Bacillus subtilis]|nr:hypothetical protein [Bacillus subtilis]
MKLRKRIYLSLIEENILTQGKVIMDNWKKNLQQLFKNKEVEKEKLFYERQKYLNAKREIIDFSR